MSRYLIIVAYCFVYIATVFSDTYSTDFSSYDATNWDLYNNICQHCSKHNGTQCCFMSNESVSFGAVIPSNKTGAIFTTTRLATAKPCGALCQSGYMVYKKQLLYAHIKVIAKWFPPLTNSSNKPETGQGYIGMIAINQGSSTIFGFHAEYQQWPYQLTTNTYTAASSGTDNDKKINTKTDLSNSFNEFEIIWTNASIQWILNGEMVRKETDQQFIPQIPMQLRLHDRSQNCPEMSVGQQFIAEFTYFESSQSVTAKLIDQTIQIESTRDINTTYTLSINTEQETMTLRMLGADNIWMGVIFGAEDMFNASAYVYYLENNSWILAERYLTGEVDAGQLIEIIDTNRYNVLHTNGDTLVIFERPWIGSHPTSFNLSNDDTVFQYGFARGLNGALEYHEAGGRSHAAYTLKHEHGLIDQTFLIESTRDINTTYTLSINTAPQTMTLTMFGPENVWMGVIFGAEDMFNASAYVYYLENNSWIFAERYLTGEQDAGQLIEIIDTNKYNVITENGTTTLTFTRPWIGSHPTSFTLSNDDTIFHYGFARGVNQTLIYHRPEGRSHAFHVLQRSDTNQTNITGQLQCDGTAIGCDAFCGVASTETVLIGVEDAECKHEPSHDTKEMNETEIEGCIEVEIGCGIEWLCQMLTDEAGTNSSSSTCSTADILLNVYQLECDVNDHGTFATTTRYTQYKLKQFCCDSDNCMMEKDVSCLHSDTLDMYNDYLSQCMYSKNAVDNKWNKVKECNDTLDNNDFEETCDFWISQSYSVYGCQCKSSFLMGHEKENEHYNELISKWNMEELEPQITALRNAGCASDIVCVPNDKNDDVFVGGLLNIERVLHILECQVFFPYSLINETINKDIKEGIEHIDDRIYVKFSDDVENMEDVSAKGRMVDILVVYLDASKRDLLYKNWTTFTDSSLNITADWFGVGSIISNVKKTDINETLQFYGAEVYYERPSRNTQTAFIGSIVFAVVIGILLIILSIMCRL